MVGLVHHSRLLHHENRNNNTIKQILIHDDSDDVFFFYDVFRQSVFLTTGFSVPLRVGQSYSLYYRFERLLTHAYPPTRNHPQIKQRTIQFNYS